MQDCVTDMRVHGSNICCLQATLLPDVSDTVAKLHEAQRLQHASTPGSQPFIMIDGYHGFGAIPTDLSGVADKVVYVRYPV